MANPKTSPLPWLGIALVVAIALMAILGILTYSTYGGTYGMMGSGSWGWATLMMGVPAVVLIVILLVALGGLREPAAYPGYASPAQQPLDILEQRYARGELTREAYLQIRNDLGRGPNKS